MSKKTKGGDKVKSKQDDYKYHDEVEGHINRNEKNPELKSSKSNKGKNVDDDEDPMSKKVKEELKNQEGPGPKKKTDPANKSSGKDL